MEEGLFEISESDISTVHNTFVRFYTGLNLEMAELLDNRFILISIIPLRKWGSETTFRAFVHCMHNSVVYMPRPFKASNSMVFVLYVRNRAVG